MEKTIKVCLMGFGNVSQAFIQLVKKKEEEIAQSHGVKLIFTGIVSGGHGRALDASGLDTDEAILLHQKGRSLDELSARRPPRDIKEFIIQSGADFLFENTPVNYETGEPAASHIRAALTNGIHAISANKGPVAHAYRELTALAQAHGVRFLFESAVMDGAPVFSMFREALPVIQINSFEGILNSCTNLLLERMEDGVSFSEAIAYAQKIGIAETDPSGDVDGWDAAIKVAALCTVLMGAPLKPQDVEREGIRDLSLTEIQQAQRENQRWKLVCRAERVEGGVRARVRPEIVPAQSPLYSINGTSSFVVFHTDMLPGLGILESNPGPDTTAYGLLSDMLNIIKNKKP